jgi:hypothetical protein
MSEIKILEQVEHEQNAFYDPSKANNGGGYHQPYEVTLFEYEGQIYRFIYCSTSCGDFGSRYTKTLYQNGKELAETEVNQVDRNEVYRYGFHWDNPLHLEMYRAGLLSQWDFYEEEEDDEE